MDRIIEVKARGSYLWKDNACAGVQHEGNAKVLRIEFDEGWDGFAKTVTFWNALGENPVKRILTADLLEDLSENTRIYLCHIPGEAMTDEGELTFVIDGYVDGKRQRSMSDTLTVEGAPYEEEADEPTDPTPTQAEQLQVQIDTILDDMSAEAQRAETARDGAEKAQQAAETAQSAAEQSEEEARVSEHNAEVWAEGGQLEGHGGEAVPQIVQPGAKGYAGQAETSAKAAAVSEKNAAASEEQAAASEDEAIKEAYYAMVYARGQGAAETKTASLGAEEGYASSVPYIEIGRAYNVTVNGQTGLFRAEPGTDGFEAFGVAVTQSHILNNNIYAVEIQIEPVYAEAVTGASGYAATANQKAQAASVYAHNAQVWNEGGTLRVLDENYPIPDPEVVGAKTYAEQAQTYAEQAQTYAEGAATSEINAKASEETAVEAADSTYENRLEAEYFARVLRYGQLPTDLPTNLVIAADKSVTYSETDSEPYTVPTVAKSLEIGRRYYVYVGSTQPSAEFVWTGEDVFVNYNEKKGTYDVRISGEMAYDQTTYSLTLQNGTLGFTGSGRNVTVTIEAADPRALPPFYDSVAEVAENTESVAEDTAEAAESAEAAAASEQAAKQYAESVNPDEIRSQIAAKGDNLEFDAETNLLWLTANGERIGDGIKVATSGGSGGGGGGESNNATLSLKNTTGWIYKSIALGAECPISFGWSSLEDEMPTGSGVLKISVGGSVKHTTQIEQGSHTMDIGPYLPAGSSTVKVNITDVYGNSRSISFNLTVVELTLTSTFDARAAYSGAFQIPYTPTAAVEKTVTCKVDGTALPTVTVTTSGREVYFDIPAQSHGCHQIELYFTAMVDGESVESNHLHYAVICTESGNNRPIIAVDWRAATVEQFATLAIPYRVYDPASLTANVQLHSGETGETQSLSVDRTQQIWSYRPETVGDLTLTLTCIGADAAAETAVVLLEMTVTETKIEVNAETEKLSLYLTSYGRSNNEENPSQWSYGDVAASLTGFNFTSDGWVQDEDGITVLRVGGDARVEIPVQMFAQDFRSTGKTIEIEFASRSVLDYDAIIATCWTGDRGFQITAQQATLKSEKSEVTTRYKEDDHLRLSFVIEKRSGNRLIIGYVNGIISGMMQYPDSDDFSQAVPVTVTLGSNDCTIDVYNIRVYESDLNRFQMLDNWIADTQNLGDKADRYERNNIFDQYDQILPTTLRPQQCYLIINCPVLPTYKGDKKTCSGTYVDPVHPERSFTFTGAQIDVQGTSSQFYYVKNFKIKFKGGFILINGTKVTVYAMNDNAVPTSEFTFKADVASSEGANNVVLAEIYNDLCPVKTPAQEADPRVRQCIEGHPIVVFHDAGSGPKFIGKYNFNNDKGTAEVFGFTTGDESWEIKENGNAQVSFKTDDFTNWQTSFEARYPDGNTDITRLQQFVAWVASTDTTVAGLTDAEKAERLAKFKDELADWADVEDAIFYYLFTLVFLCIDQREKNAFPTYNAAMAKWIWLFYDADSSIGTDNKGNLTFEYWMEDIDFTEAGDPVFNGQNNVFWTNLRTCFATEIRDEYRRLRTDLGADGKALLSYDKVNELFTEHQSQWSEAIYNEDAWRKAVEPLEKANDPQYLPMQQGKKEQHFKHWMYNRFRYLDSKFETGAALDEENRIMMRAHAQGNIFLTSYINMYGQVYFNSERSEERMIRDTEYEFEWTAMGAEDAVIGVNSAPMITSLGDLSHLMLEYCHIQYAKHLTELKVGDAADTYVNDNFVALTLGNNTLLRKLDVRNCTRLTQAVDASGCTNIEEVYFDGTAITGVSLPNGGILKKLHLPATITDLTLRNQTKLTEFVLPSYANISTLRLENVADCVDGWSILHEIPANSRVRMIGFDWTLDDAAAVLALYDRLDTMRGLDENGGNMDTAQMQGTIRIDSLTGAQLAEMQSRYPSVKIVYQHITSNLYFYDDTGMTLLYTAAVADGGDGTYGGSTPTKASTAQYSYTFAGGWSLTPGGAASANALKAVTADRKVYAVFTATVRTYTVTWMNGTTTLETDTNVPYGTTPTYNGSDPTHSDPDYEWNGWSPAVGPITGDATYTAVFKYSGYAYSSLIARTITEYSSDNLQSMGDNAFRDCTSLSSVNLPAITSVPDYAFQGCAALSEFDFSNITTVGKYAFAMCSQLSEVNAPILTSVGSNAFTNCSNLTSVSVPNLGSIQQYAFQYCGMTVLDLPKVTSIAKYGIYYSSQLSSLILRSNAMCTLANTNALNGTKIKSGTGYIYVPTALLDSYKAASNWSTYAAQFRALEDYTVDGTTTGALDETKI